MCTTGRKKGIIGRNITWKKVREKRNLTFLFVSRATFFENEHEWQKTEPVPIYLHMASRNFPIVKTRNFFFYNWTLETIPFIHLGKQQSYIYSKHWPYTVAHIIDCVCSKMLNHGLNHGLFLSLFKLISRSYPATYIELPI